MSDARCEELAAQAQANFNKPPLHVKHAELAPTGDSRYRSQCPECKFGALLVQRDQKTMELKQEDHCVICARRFIYDDFQGMLDGTALHHAEGP